MRLASLGALLALAACSAALTSGTDAAPATGDASMNGDASIAPGADGSVPDASPPDAAAQGPGVFVAVGYGGRTARSLDDAATWVDDQSLVPNGGDDNYLLRTVVWTGKEFVALGWRRMTSPDGKKWTDYGVVKGTNWFGSVAFVGGVFVAVGGYGMKVTSPDGASWTDHSIDTGAAHSWDGLAAGGGAFAMTNDDGVREHSADGATWKVSGGSASKSTDVAFGNGAFVALAGTTVLRSTDGGATFQSSATLPSAAEGLVYAQGHFTATGVGHIFTSNDGVAWADHAVAGDWRGPIVFGHGSYVHLGNGKRMRSADGLTWGSPAADGPSNGLVMLAFGQP